MNGYLCPASKVLPGMLMAVVMLASITVRAETGYFAIPALSISEVYDDNLFFDISNQDSDLITRISPALEVGYESETLNWTGRYRFDAENYDKFTNLDSSLARRFADGVLEYTPNSRLTFSAKADYTKTNTPADLSLVPGGAIQGLLVGRTPAERTSISPALEYSFTSTIIGSLAYTKTNDKLLGGVESDVNMVEAEIEQKLSPTNAVSYGYIYRHYRFDDESGQANVTTPDDSRNSHTSWLGLSHDWSPRTRVVVRAGPRIYQHSVEPYLLLSLRRNYTRGSLLVSYERDETTLLGDVGRVEAETLSATFSRQFGSNLEFQIIPAYAKVSQQGSAVDIFRVAMEGKYKINDAIFLTAAYNLYLQRVEFIGGNVEKVSRNVIELGITFTWPRRKESRDKSDDDISP